MGAHNLTSEKQFLMIQVFKLLAVIAALTVASTCITTNASAQGRMVEFKQVVGIAQNDSLNIRSGPGRKFADVGDISNGAILKVLGYDPSGRWAKLRRTGRDVWVSSKFLADIQTNPNTSPKPNAHRLGAHVVTGISANDPDSGLNVRSKPGRSGRVKAILQLSTPVDVDRMSADGKWSFIRGSFGKGWVQSKHLVKALPNNVSGNGQTRQQPTQSSQDDQGWHLPAVYSVTGVAQGDKLWVRNQPNTKSAPVNNLAPGAAVSVLAWLSNGWAKVTVGQNTGYVNGGFLQRGSGQQMQNGFPLGLICAGTEPFWLLGFNTNQTITFKQADRPKPRVSNLQMTAPSNSPDGYPYSFRAARFSGLLDQRICSDGMSDTKYGWSLKLSRNRPNGTSTIVYGCCRLR